MGGISGLFVGAVLLVGGGEEKGVFQGPGWYHLRLEPSREMVVRIVDVSKGTFSCVYQGFSVELPDSQIVSMQSISHSEKSPKGLALTGEQHAKVLDAIDALAHPDFKVRKRAHAILRRYFPACRPVIHDALTHHARRVRALSVKLLGEEGAAPEDWMRIVALLRDTDFRVRLAAIMALRRLGPGNSEPLVEYLATETVANNRKMAIRNLERWKDPAAVRGLIGLLGGEQDREVRVFIARALKAITGKDHGEEADAWTVFLEAQEKKQHDA